MNASTFFTTLGGNTYLYDATNMYMVNMHPIVELIHIYNNPHCSYLILKC